MNYYNDQNAEDEGPSLDEVIEQEEATLRANALQELQRGATEIGEVPYPIKLLEVLEVESAFGGRISKQGIIARVESDGGKVGVLSYWCSTDHGDRDTPPDQDCDISWADNGCFVAEKLVHGKRAYYEVADAKTGKRIARRFPKRVDAATFVTSVKVRT